MAIGVGEWVFGGKNGNGYVLVGGYFVWGNTYIEIVKVGIAMMGCVGRIYILLHTC